MEDKQSAPEPIAEDARIISLDARLDAVRKRSDKGNRDDVQASDASYRLGNRVLAELIGGIGGGAFIGWVIDHFAGTTPWGLLVVMFLGIIAAFRNIIRISSRQND